MNKSLYRYLSLIIIALMLFSGCSINKDPGTLESMVDSNEELSAAIQSAAADTECSIDIKDNTITYSYDISTLDGVTDEVIKKDAFIESAEASIASQEESLVELCRSIEEMTGISGIVVNLRYTYGKKKVSAASFTAADQDENETAESN